MMTAETAVANEGMYVRLRDYLEFRIATLEDKMNANSVNSDKALILARGIADDQREASNYVRDQLREQAATFPTKATLSAQLDAMNQRSDRLMERCAELERMLANLQGRIWALGVGVTVVFTIVQIILRFLQKT